MRSKGNNVTLGGIVGTDRALVFPKGSRDKHLYVCGATGTGKSKFLENLIRQDIRGWFKSRCGMLLLDPHGSLYDSLIQWLGRANVTRLPIIPIDLRQDEWVVSYNALRRRDSDGAVVIENFVQAMAHVWGASGTDQTPLFARWATNILRTLYENDLTLLEAEYLINHLDREARHALMQKLEDRFSKRDWQFANALSPRDFEMQLGSTANRLNRFLRNKHMRSMFGHGKTSLDLRKALDEGHIILVSLASAGARVSEEDADLFATLLLSDLWTAAQERGKVEGVKPFYLYVDEFQRFVTPTIAKNLDQARGFGLHVTMANQFPGQLLNQGQQGKQLYDSIMENASSKIAFRLHSEENLRPMAQWLFRGVMNPEEIKLSMESTKVLAYEEREARSRTTGASTTTATGRSESDSTSEFAGESASESSGEGQDTRVDFYGEELDWHRAESAAESLSRSAGSSSAHQESVSSSEATTESLSETVGSVLVPILGKELSHVQFRSLEEQLERAMGSLFGQEERQGVVRLVGMKAPVSIHTPTVPQGTLSPERIRAYVGKLLEKWSFALPAAQASAELAERERLLELQLRQSAEAGEPESSRRRISP